MERDDLDDLGDDSRFVPGIYNYCDRWCERCPYTERCRTFAMGERMKREADAEDAEPQEAPQPANEAEPDAGDFFPEPDGEWEPEEDEEWDDEDFQEFQRREERKDRVARSHPCARAAWRYTNMAEAWWKAHEAEVNEKLELLGAEPPADPAAPDPGEEAILLQDATEVIGWHQHQIWVKLMRALHEDDHMKELAEEMGFPKDSDGSAKVALVGMDRSIAAWADVGRLLPSAAESVEPMVELLVRLRRLAERQFPDARAFIRPGFDEPLPPPGEEEDEEE